jgi:integrative and conjugative element protein (TIGR02256 family)
MEDRGVSRERFLLALQVAVIRNPEDSPLYVLLGTPMRGVRGSGSLQQHLSAWRLEPVVATGLRLTVEKYSGHAKSQEIGARVEALIWDWAESAAIGWCAVREDRPQIVTRRDHAAPIAWFEGKSVVLWGCGALGSHAAEFLVRGGVRKLLLCDNGKVAHGLLVRQQFDDADVGDAKAVALARRLRRIRDDVEIEVCERELIYKSMSGSLWGGRPDLVIDSTGSRAILKILEAHWSSSAECRVAVASLAVGPAAERAMAVVVRPTNSGGPLDAVRRAKLEACSDVGLTVFRDEFWPLQSATDKKFQPEPGCSDPTFVGSAADIAIMAGSMVNLIARDLVSVGDTTSFAHFLTRPDVSVGATQRAMSHHCWSAERSLSDGLRNYDVRISSNAWQNVLRLIEISRKKRGPLVETGGLLLGERDDAARVIWVTDATAPPPDSRASRDAFVCGTLGNAALDSRRRSETLGSVRFVGMWHTHPGMSPQPSTTDLKGMRRIVSSVQPPIAQALLLIVGHTPATPTPAAFLFSRGDFMDGDEEVATALGGDSAWPWLKERWWRLTDRLRSAAR